jgi:hypothetical protein
VGAGAIGTLGVLLAPEAVFAGGDHREEVELLRWDLIQIVEGVVLAGGTDVARDAATGDKISLTGSGDVRPEKHKATGGCTFVHHHANGSEVGHGVCVVTGFKSFANGGGSLVGTGLTDGIDELSKTTGGLLLLKVHLQGTSGAAADGVLEVHCDLPGGKPETEACDSPSSPSTSCRTAALRCSTSSTTSVSSLNGPGARGLQLWHPFWRRGNLLAIRS